VSVAIAAALSRRHGREWADGIMAMVGPVTTFAAVEHGQAHYEPEVVQGTVLDRVEIDRRLDQHPEPGRRPAADDCRHAACRRRLILACIIATIIDALPGEVVTVGHGLRHSVPVGHFWTES
jgi:exopolyphosphatase / guanosine-5'-triphosphate,3'-diphosphate pyrophosphatase